MNTFDWPTLQDAIERDDLAGRSWLGSWFADCLARRPDILERLWVGSRDVDAVGWRWCEYSFRDRQTFPPVFLALYAKWIGRLPTAPVFVLRAPCRHCGQLGFFVTWVHSKPAREARGRPKGRCAECKKAAGLEWSRRWRVRKARGDGA